MIAMAQKKKYQQFEKWFLEAGACFRKFTKQIPTQEQ
jgi:hypothetical protein